jgi:hypothetical protein
MRTDLPKKAPERVSVPERIQALKAEVQRLREMASHPSCDGDFSSQLSALADEIHEHIDVLLSIALGHAPAAE